MRQRAGQKEVGKQNSSGEHQREEALGEEGQPRRAAGDQQRQPLIPGTAGLEEEIGGDEGTRHQAGEYAVEDRRCADRDREQAREHDGRCQWCCAPVRVAAQQESGGECRQADAEGRRQTDAEGSVAEDLHARCDHPVAPHGLFEVGHAVEPRHDPITGVQHLTRDFAVAVFVGRRHGPQAQRHNVEHNEEHEDDRAPGSESASWHSSITGSWEASRSGRLLTDLPSQDEVEEVKKSEKTPTRPPGYKMQVTRARARYRCRIPAVGSGNDSGLGLVWSNPGEWLSRRFRDEDLRS